MSAPSPPPQPSTSIDPPAETPIDPPKDEGAPPSYDEAARMPTTPPPINPLDPTAHPSHHTWLPPHPSAVVTPIAPPQQVLIVNNRNQVVAVVDRTLIEEMRRRRRNRIWISLTIFLITLILCSIIVIPISIS